MAVSSRNNATLTSSTASSRSANGKPTPDDELIENCIELLQQKYPKGLTIKEMAAEMLLDSQPDHIKAICRSSTVLSTKLNSFYRRCHPDFRTQVNEKYPTCPITRQVCPNQTNRLMYKYVTDEDRVLEPTSVKKSVSPMESEQKQTNLSKKSAMAVSKVTRPISPPPVDEEEAAEFSSNNNDTCLAPGKVDAPLSPPPGPDSPPEDGQQDGKNGHYMLRKVIKKTPHAFVPPSKRKSFGGGGQQGPVEKRMRSEGGKGKGKGKTAAPKAPVRSTPAVVVDIRPNPYYEPVSVAVLDGEYSKPWIEDAKWEDYHLPEALSMEDLDTLLD